MHIIKIERNASVDCNKVEAFLRKRNIPHHSLNIQSTNKEEMEQANAHLQSLSLFSTPVTILFDGERIVDYVQGYDEKKLNILIRNL